MTSEFKIEKGVPAPKPRVRHQYPFADMNVGDSFFAKADQHRVGNAARSAGKVYGMKFTTRVENGGCRVWRIK